MCGNGLRCVAKHLLDREPSRDAVEVETGAGVLPARARRVGGEVVEVEIELGPARLDAPHLPRGPGGGPFVGAAVPGVDWPGTAVSMGNPHLVLLGAPAEVVRAHGPRLEHLPGFPRPHERRGGESRGGGAPGVGVGARLGADRRLQGRARPPRLPRRWWRAGCRPDVFVPVDLPGGRLAVRVLGRYAAHHVAWPGALRLRRRAAGGAARLTPAPSTPPPAAPRPLQLWVVDPRAQVRAWLAARLAQAGHAVEWVGAPGELERQEGAPDVLIIGVLDDPAALDAFRGGFPDVPVVAWMEPGRPVPQLTAPFEWASSADGGALLAAVERSVPWVNLRCERDAARAESAAARREAELHRRAAALLRDPDAEGFHELLLGELLRAAGASAGALWLADDAGRFVLRATGGSLAREAYPELLAPDAHARALLSSGRPWLVDGPGLSGPAGGARGGAGTRPARGCAGGLPGRGAGVHRGARRRRSGSPALVPALPRAAAPRPPGPGWSAYNLAYFTDVATKEVDKARRYGRGFSLLSFALEGLPHLRAHAGAEQARAVVRATTRALGRVLPRIGRAGEGGGAGVSAPVPETDAFGAQVFLRRALAAAREAPELSAVDGGAPLQLTGGAASFPRDGEDLDFLIAACRARLEQRRASLHRQLVLDAVGIWEAVELLLGSPDGPRLPAEEGADPSRRGRVPGGAVRRGAGGDRADPAPRAVAAEPGVPGRRRGRGRAAAGQDAPRANGEFAPRVYLLARRAEVTRGRG